MLAVNHPAVNLLGTLAPPAPARILNEADIRHALAHPIGVTSQHSTFGICELVPPGESLCIVVSDHTRKTAADRVLPVLLAGLRERGVSPADAFVLVASGIHRSSTDEEVAAILGPEAWAEFRGRVRRHDPDDDAQLVHVGTTRRGHAVRINRAAVEADRVILIGAAMYHYHAGFGGGRKSLVPGLASRDTIAWNHSLTLDPEADRIRPGVEPGRLDGNAVAEEMLECAGMCPPDAIINTVLGPSGELAGVFAGDLQAAHRAACELAAHLGRVALPQQADIVVASAGGARTWIQSHKALFNAHRAMRPGGRIVLEAPCPEGLGNARFRHWLGCRDVPALYAELRHTPEVNGQTALSTRIRGADAILVTDLDEDDRALLGIETAPTREQAVERAVVAVGTSRPTCWLMPHAGSTVPFA